MAFSDNVESVIESSREIVVGKTVRAGIIEMTLKTPQRQWIWPYNVIFDAQMLVNI